MFLIWLWRVRGQSLKFKNMSVFLSTVSRTVQPMGVKLHCQNKTVFYSFLLRPPESSDWACARLRQFGIAKKNNVFFYEFLINIAANYHKIRNLKSGASGPALDIPIQLFRLLCTLDFSSHRARTLSHTETERQTEKQLSFINIDNRYHLEYSAFLSFM